MHSPSTESIHNMLLRTNNRHITRYMDLGTKVRLLFRIWPEDLFK